MANTPDDLAGTQRAAILLMSLGEQDAANVLKQLDAREVQKIGIAMAELKEVSREQASSVLDKFIGIADGKANMASGSTDYVRRVLTQAVGKQKTDMLLDRVSTGQAGQGIEQLKWMEAKAVAQIIGGEHPQIAAIVLSHLEAEQSAAIMPLLSDDFRTEVLMRIASLNEVPQTALTELDQLVEKQANVKPPAPLRRVGGARTVANILNAMEKDKSGEEMGKIEKSDAAMHQQIKDLLFIFDNLLDVDDRGIQALLREVGSDTLAVALRGAEPEVQEKILKNMSKRAAEILKDDMEARGPVKLVDVEAAQKEIIVIAQRLAEEGTITLGGKSAGVGRVCLDRTRHGKSRGTTEDGHRRRPGRFAGRSAQGGLRTRLGRRARSRSRRGARASGALVRHVLRPRQTLRGAGYRGRARAADAGHGSGAANRAARIEDRSHADHRHHPRCHRGIAGGGP